MNKLTFGEQVNRNIEKQIRSPDKQEAGETSEAYGKDFMKKIDESIRDARSKGIKGKIYIHILERPCPFVDNALYHKIFVRKSRPTPEQCSYLYSHEEVADSPKFEYCLPELQHVPFVFANRQKFTEKYLNDVTLWLQNKLT